MNTNDLSKLISLFSQNNINSNRQNAEKIVNGLDSEKRSELNSILNNRDKVNEILNSPAAKKIIDKLNGNGNGQHQ